MSRTRTRRGTAGNTSGTWADTLPYRRAKRQPIVGGAAASAAPAKAVRLSAAEGRAVGDQAIRPIGSDEPLPVEIREADPDRELPGGIADEKVLRGPVEAGSVA